jgi:hypothetical protein
MKDFQITVNEIDQIQPTEQIVDIANVGEKLLLLFGE